MRGQVDDQGDLFCTLNLEKKVPADHPLRMVKRWADRVLRSMSRDFDAAYGYTGRPGIPPEQLLKALLLQALYSIPSEIKLMEAIDFNLLYRWFLGMKIDASVWTPEVFSMNRQRFLDHDLVRQFFDRVVHEAMAQGLVSADHFTIDGTLIRSLASQKSLVPRDGRTRRKDHDDNPPAESAIPSRDKLVDWKGEKRSNDTHVSRTDHDAMLARKGAGRGAELCHSGHVAMENRNGLCLDLAIDHADGHAERRNALEMLARLRRRHRLRPKTVGLDAGYDDGKFLAAVENRGIIPHVPLRGKPVRVYDEASEARQRAWQRRRTVGYQVSQRIRKRVEQIFGWGKTVGRWARTRFLGHERIEAEALMTAAAYNLLRMCHLVPAG